MILEKEKGKSEKTGAIQIKSVAELQSSTDVNFLVLINVLLYRTLILWQTEQRSYFSRELLQELSVVTSKFSVNLKLFKKNFFK